MDEQNKNQTTQPSVPNPYEDEINAMYDAQRQQQLQSLESAYNQNVQTLQNSRAQIAPMYATQANDLNAQYERQRAAMNEQMAANGLNVGAGSQAQLAQNAGYQNAFSNIKTAQADAERAVDQRLADLEVSYKNSVAQAIADNDYQRAAALMKEKKEREQANLDKAKLLASYGDFSMYAQLYGEDTANNMRSLWNAQNPEYAYMSGNLSADQYYMLTGQYPTGYQPSSSYGGYTYDPNSPNGPGTFPSEGGDGDEYDISDFNVKLWQYIDKYGSESAALQQMRTEAFANMRSAAEKEALARGLKPGTQAYDRYVNTTIINSKDTNPDYLAVTSALSSNAQDAKAKRLADESRKTKEEAKNAAKNTFTDPDYWFNTINSLRAQGLI